MERLENRLGILSTTLLFSHIAECQDSKKRCRNGYAVVYYKEAYDGHHPSTPCKNSHGEIEMFNANFGYQLLSRGGGEDQTTDLFPHIVPRHTVFTTFGVKFAAAQSKCLAFWLSLSKSVGAMIDINPE